MGVLNGNCPRDADGWTFDRTGGGLWLLFNGAGDYVMGGLEFCPFCGAELGVEDHKPEPAAVA